MTELGTALRELVDRRQVVDGQDAGDLWRRGRQRVRRRRAIATAIVALLTAALARPRPCACCRRASAR